MWGRELRAGMVFVLLSVVVGGAFRGWQRAHHERFDEIVASLVRSEAEDPSAPEPGSGAQAPSVADSMGSRDRSRSARPRRAPMEAPRPSSIDVDRAGVEELVRLPGIGPALASRIVADRRSNGPFGGPEGLLRVPGIGPKTLAKIRDYLTPSPRSAPRAATEPAPATGTEPAPATPERPGDRAK